MTPANPRTSKKQQSYANKILSSIPSDELGVIAPKLQQVTYELGDVIQDPEEASEFAYFVEEGIASLVAVMKSGDNVEVGIVGYEGVFPATSVLGNTRVSRRALVQSVPMTAYRIPAVAFQDLFRELPNFQTRVLRFMEGQSVMVSQTAACNALHQVEERLAKWLLMCRDRVHSETLPLTQEFLAIMLGVRRTTVTQVAGVLHKEGLIKYSRGKITILDRAKLEERACECYSVMKDQFIALTNLRSQQRAR